MSAPARLSSARRRERQRVRIVLELAIGAAAIWFVAHPSSPLPSATADTDIAVAASVTDPVPVIAPVPLMDSSRPSVANSAPTARDSAVSRRLIPSLRIPRPVLPARLLTEGRLFRNTAERARAGERIAVTMTAYCLQGRTRRGNLVRDGIIAVDRSLFPLGREVDLFFGRSNYGRFLADDTGRDIVGGRIDVWIEDCRAARRFGRRRGFAQLAPRDQ